MRNCSSSYYYFFLRYRTKPAGFLGQKLHILLCLDFLHVHDLILNAYVTGFMEIVPNRTLEVTR